MTSPKLQILARQMARHQQPERAPAPASDDLAAAIERLVQERVDQAMEQQPAKTPAHVRRLLDQQFDKPPMPSDYRELPPVAKTAPKKSFGAIFHRDGAGQILWAEMSNGVKLEAVRDGAGNIVAMRQVEESPVLPALDIAAKAEARAYHPGEPR